MTNDLSTGLLGRPHLCQPVGPARRAGGPNPNPPKPPAGSGCSARTRIDLLWQLMLFQLGYIGTAFPRIPLPAWLERVPRPNSNVCVRACARLPTPTSNSWTPAGQSRIQLDSNTVHPETESDSTGKRLRPTSPPSTSDANCKSQLSPVLLTDWL